MQVARVPEQPDRVAAGPRRVPIRVLVGVLTGWLALDTLLLWRFLGLLAAPGLAIGAVAMAGLVLMLTRATPRGDGPGLAGLAALFGFACAIFLLGGEGRLFYANIDWIVRDAVLRDMAVHPWPFAYIARGLPEMLRAPIGMFLVPALAMKAGGQAAGDCALLIQNSALLTIVLALGRPLFRGARAATIALAVVIAFSGLDVIGAMLVDGVPGFLSRDHVEWWSGLQFSSHITQAFWAPQHALAGWIGAVGFMLWHDRRLPLGVFLALVPLTVPWSPLGAIGVLPFALLAGWRTLATGTLEPRDLALPALATIVSVPALLYLGAAGDTVGLRIHVARWLAPLMLLLLEALPFLWFAARAKDKRFGVATVVAIGMTLVGTAYLRIGWSSDFTMRASIPALAILSVIVADRVAHDEGGARAMLVILLVLGSYTGFTEVRRAIALPASPPPRCDFIAAFQDWGPNPDAAKSNYLAAVASLPGMIRPAHVTLVDPRDPARCLSAPWPRPTGLFL